MLEQGQSHRQQDEFAGITHPEEQSLIAGLLAHPHAIGNLSQTLSTQHFINKRLARIFTAIKAVVARDGITEVTALNVGTELEPADRERANREVEELHKLAAMGVLDDVGDAANVVEREGGRRLLHDEVQKLFRAAAEKQQTKDDVLGSIMALGQSAEQGGVAQSLEEVLLAIADRSKVEESEARVPTGFTRLDKALSGGLYMGKMYIIAAAAKNGKTMLMSQACYQIATSDVPELYLCLESSAQEVVSRLVAADLEVNATKLMVPNKKMAEKVREEAKSFRNKKVFFENAHGATINQIISTISSAVIKHGIKVVFIDYLQLIDGRENKAENRASFLGKVSRALAGLAKRHNIAIVCAAQRNRQGLLRETDAPLMDADMVIELEKVPPINAAFDHQELYLKITHSRYTPAPAEIGDKDAGLPALVMMENIGPVIREEP